MVALIQLVLENASVAAESEDLGAALSFWRRVASGERWTQDWAQLAMAGADFTALCLEHYSDQISGQAGEDGVGAEGRLSPGEKRARWEGGMGMHGGAAGMGGVDASLVKRGPQQSYF